LGGFPPCSSEVVPDPLHRRTPLSPGWVKHGSHNCPGDEANGIFPAPACAVAAIIGEDDDDDDGDDFVTANGISPAPAHAVAAIIGEDDDDDDGDDFVTAVFPMGSCILGNGSFSEDDYSY